MTGSENVAQFPRRLRLRCSGCGATQDAVCACGVAYVPASEFAAKGLAENPSLSDRAISARTGVAPNTVKQHRDATAQDCAVETKTRIGLDGKERVLPTSRRERPPDAPPERLEETRATAPHEDHLSPIEADRALRNTANYVKGAFLNPPPGIRACLRDAVARASRDDVRAIIAAADFLSELKDAINGN